MPVVEDAELAAIIESHAVHALGNGMPIRARIAVDSGSHRAGNTGEGFEAFQAPIDRKIHQILQHSPAVRYTTLPAATMCVAMKRRTIPRKPSSDTMRFVPPPITM